MSSGVLEGLRILEIGHFLAAPFAARLLADLGAEVVKIEPLEGDPARQWGEQLEGRSLWWSVQGRNKRSIAVNLKDPRGRDLALGLAAESDAVIENFRPGQLARLGLGDDALRRARPDLVVAHISGYGQTGPYRDRAAFGVIGEAIGGLRHLTNHPPGTTDLPPVRVGISIGDSVAGLYAVFGLMAALWQRDRGSGGAGRQPYTLDVALTESIFSLMEGMLPEFGVLGKVKSPTGGGIATAAPTNAYPTADGTWVLIAANSDPLFAKLVRLMGRPELAEEPRFKGNKARVEQAMELDHLIGEWTHQRPIAELIALLAAADIPSCKTYTAADCAGDPQYLERGMLREVFDPVFGRAVLHPGIVPRVAESPGTVRWPGPPVGAHTDEVLRSLLKRSADEIRELREQGVVR